MAQYTIMIFRMTYLYSVSRPVARGGSLGAEEPSSLNKRSTILLKMSTILFIIFKKISSIL